jgi:hypothetical protein
MNKSMQVRQGDILLEKIDQLPQGLEKLESAERIIIAEGELTGHAHTINAECAVLFREQHTGVTYLDIFEALTALEHQEHAPIMLQKGFYKVTRQREYDPFLSRSEIRSVAD